MKKLRFTLIEIMVSLAVLTLSLTGLLQLLSASQGKLGSAVDKWRNMHMLTQAAEYVLMHAEEDREVPEDFFPYSGYAAVTTFDEVEELPEELSDIDGQLPLRKCTIEIQRLSDHKIVEQAIIERISYNDDSDTSTNAAAAAN